MKLEMMSGPEDGEIFDLAKEKILIGRGPNNDIRLTYAGKVSNKHATILTTDKDSFLIDHGTDDKGSTNGTRVIKSDNQKIEIKRGKTAAPIPGDRIAIQAGDIIIFGETIWMKFLGA